MELPIKNNVYVKKIEANAKKDDVLMKTSIKVILQ